MPWLNYNHLHYFWTTAREGSIARAAAKLKRSQPTLSAQLRLLEGQVGEKLFVRAGRGIQVTDMGREVFRYAEDIFSVGENLSRMLEGRPQLQQVQLVAGIVDALPKALSHALLKPATEGPAPLRIICREDRAARLLHSLALNELDLVLLDRPAENPGRQPLRSQLLGQAPLSFFGAPAFAKLRRSFPRSLHQARLLLPTPECSLRNDLDRWFEARHLQPQVAGEFEDASLLAEFGQEGHGIFAAPSSLAARLRRDRGVIEIGRPSGLSLRVYAVTSERSASNRSVLRLMTAGQALLRVR